MKKPFPLLTLSLLAFCLLGLAACKTSEEVGRDGGSLERQLNYENAVQQEAALLGPAIY